MKIKDLIFKLRHVIAIALIVAISLVCFAWIAEDTLDDTEDQWQRTIFNDDYSTLTEAITGEAGVLQQVYVPADGDLYGVNLLVHTYGRMCSGKMYVDLINSDGKVIATACEDLSTVYHDNFKRFMFGEDNLASRKSQYYTLHIYTEPETPQDKVALWKSKVKVNGLEDIVENGAPSNGTLAVQYITDYVSDQVAPYFKILAGVMLAVLVGAYIVIFVLKLKIHTTFLCLALGIGFVFSIFTPINGAPDEYVHIGMSYHNSNLMMGYEDSYVDGRLLVRECDYGDILYHTSYTAFDIRDMYEGFFEKNESGDQMTRVWARWSEGYFPPLYWAQAAGITLARLLGLGRGWMLIMGRLGNLVLYTALVYFAIRLMPFFKNLLAVIALTPIPLQLAGSFNYDPLVIGLCFLFTAKVLNLAYTKEKVKIADILLLVALAALVAPGKAVYVLVVALCLIIPPQKFGGIKKMAASIAVVFVTAAVMWLAFNQSFVSLVKDSLFPQAQTVQAEQTDETVTSADIVVNEEAATAKPSAGAAEEAAEEPVAADTPSPKDDLLENGDSRYLFSPGYILNNISDTVKLVANTIEENVVLYIYQIFGGILGEVILSPLHINWLYVVAVMFIVFLASLTPAGETLQYKGVKKWWGLAVAFGVSALLCIACITWTPVNYDLIFGIQGRYFIPVLPLIMLFITNENITIKKNIDKYLLFALVAADLLIILDGFVIMATNTTIV